MRVHASVISALSVRSRKCRCCCLCVHSGVKLCVCGSGPGPDRDLELDWTGHSTHSSDSAAFCPPPHVHTAVSPRLRLLCCEMDG